MLTVGRAKTRTSGIYCGFYRSGHTHTLTASYEGKLTQLTVDRAIALSRGNNGGVRPTEASARATRPSGGQPHRAHSRTGHNLCEPNQLYCHPRSPRVMCSPEGGLTKLTVD